MFEVTGDHIAQLGDADLRTLVARLAIAEMRANGGPVSAVTAGGHQDAPDGGIDVRVAATAPLGAPDFVPRSATGFQVKVPDMQPAEITREMRFGGALRPSIAALADANGAYIIVNSTGTVADPQVTARRQAMRNSLHDLPDPDRLHIDFYDRDRMAAWANLYPAVALWVLGKSGASTDGWQSIGRWADAQVDEAMPLLVDGEARVIDQRQTQPIELTLPDAIRELRLALSASQSSVRLIGMSGLGKTRLVQALFETGIGGEPLDPALALYTDYSEEIRPSAHEMARQLIETGTRAILVIDNCNPATHGELTRICATEGSQVSLLTVEYDVRDDEPERTEVFRLEPGSNAMIEHWLDTVFPHIPAPGNQRIAEFSDGNFRVARAIASTVDRGETVGTLRDTEMFERLFRQRNDEDPGLLDKAATLALLYSFNGEETGNESELALLGLIGGHSARELFAAATALRGRGLLQSRGPWRAILPQAIANNLAARALDRIPPAELDRHLGSMWSRTAQSFATRIGFLHISAIARALVARLLKTDGPLGDVFALGKIGHGILRKIAPVEPQATLARITDELAGSNGDAISATGSDNRHEWLSLLKALAYDPALFEDAAWALARFVRAEPPRHNNNSATSPFRELFQLKLSGTHAMPAQRRDVVRALARSGDEGYRRCASIALEALLRATRYSSMGRYDFGARQRDFGWIPATNDQAYAWLSDAIALAVELDPIMPDARTILAGALRPIWHIASCQEAVEAAATAIINVRPWPEAWNELRATMAYDGQGMSDEWRTRLAALIERLRPPDLLTEARAYILSKRGFDVMDGEDLSAGTARAAERTAARARDIGRQLADDAVTRAVFLPEAIAGGGMMRDHAMGQGLADRAVNIVGMWDELIGVYAGMKREGRSYGVLGGFIRGVHERDAPLAFALLQHSIGQPDVSELLVYLQGQIGFDDAGMARLQGAIQAGKIEPWAFRHMANGAVGDVDAELLADLLRDLANAPEGRPIAIEILGMRFHCDGDGKPAPPVHHARLIDLGRDLIGELGIEDIKQGQDFWLGDVIRACLRGSQGAATAARLCAKMADGLKAFELGDHMLGNVAAALVETQPEAVLDAFVEPSATNGIRFDLGELEALHNMDPAIMIDWAQVDPVPRYQGLSRALSLFHDDHENSSALDQNFIAVAEQAPDPVAFLGDVGDRVRPMSWSGSRRAILANRQESLGLLLLQPNEGIRRWAQTAIDMVGRAITAEQDGERRREESFE